MTKKIRVKVFDDLRRSLADAGAYEQGKPVNLRTKEIPPPPGFGLLIPTSALGKSPAGASDTGRWVSAIPKGHFLLAPCR
jgi:hypothetical protein